MKDAIFARLNRWHDALNDAFAAITVAIGIGWLFNTFS